MPQQRVQPTTYLNGFVVPPHDAEKPRTLREKAVSHQNNNPGDRGQPQEPPPHLLFSPGRQFERWFRMEIACGAPRCTDQGYSYRGCPHFDYERRKFRPLADECTIGGVQQQHFFVNHCVVVCLTDEAALNRRATQYQPLFRCDRININHCVYSSAQCMLLRCGDSFFLTHNSRSKRSLPRSISSTTSRQA